MEYGYEVINFDGVEIPTFTFGGGNVRVTSGWEDGDGLDGILLSIVPENETKEIGGFINFELEGKKFTDIPDVKCYMRFSKVESVDVVIGKLTELKSKMLANQ